MEKLINTLSSDQKTQLKKFTNLYKKYEEGYYNTFRTISRNRDDGNYVVLFEGQKKSGASIKNCVYIDDKTFSVYKTINKRPFMKLHGVIDEDLS